MYLYDLQTGNILSLRHSLYGQWDLNRTENKVSVPAALSENIVAKTVEALEARDGPKAFI